MRSEIENTVGFFLSDSTRYGKQSAAFRIDQHGRGIGACALFASRKILDIFIILLHGLLHGLIHRGIDGKTAVIKHTRSRRAGKAVFLGQVGNHILDHDLGKPRIFCIRFRFFSKVQFRFRRNAFFIYRGLQKSKLVHTPKDRISAFAVIFGIFYGIVFRGILDHGSKRRTFCGSQLRGAFPEIGLRGGFQSVAPLRQINGIEI